MLKKYLITSKEFYTDNLDIFCDTLRLQFRNHIPNYALYRDKENANYTQQATYFVNICKEFVNTT